MAGSRTKSRRISKGQRAEGSTLTFSMIMSRDVGLENYNKTKQAATISEEPIRTHASNPLPPPFPPSG
jgi:hypothetical protein